MIKEKETLLNETLEEAINIGFGIKSSENLENIFSEKLMTIGTAAEEQYTSLDGLRELIRMQREQSQGLQIHFKRNEVYRYYPADESIAIIVENIRLDITMNKETTGFDMRASGIFEFKNEQWKMIHWHVSKPDQVQSETDTYGIEEWKQKADDLEKLVAERTTDLRLKNDELNAALIELKSTQNQLIQSEKMASLGELTAGVAHEIQNPLNFVNNFSEVNQEMIDELLSEKSKVRSERNEELETEILNDIKANEEKINHHGKRADAIVKGMLQHSRQTKGVKEPTDINALCDEFLRLSYHGLRAKDKNFNADFTTNFDETIGKINIIPQDMGRVLLNLFNNAFYAVNEKKKSYEQSAMSYEPLVSVQTEKGNDKIEIRVVDNGNGIPQHIIGKIFQPFFTTKPAGQGTGLGLSLAYDIITKEHNGMIKAESKEEKGSEFIIQLPVA